MEIADQIINVALVVLPGVLVIVAAYIILKRFFDNENKKRLHEIRRDNKKGTLPMKLQAYERLTLLLERISPENLVMRVHKAGMSARMLQKEMLEAIRSEYEHNVTQQVYVSDAVWALVRNAKQETIKMVNIAAAKVGDKATGIDLSKVIFEIQDQLEKSPSQVAILYLKKEIRKNF